jgi:hypothetical protein
MAAIKKDVSDMKGMLGTMADNQGLLLKVLVLVLVLVLAGRGLDVSSLLGGIV